MTYSWYETLKKMAILMQALPATEHMGVRECDPEKAPKPRACAIVV
jgi:hypothetical protein